MIDGSMWKLWIYTNYHCNIRCTYCLAQSSPTALPRVMDPTLARSLVDEAAALGFERVFITGGEPLLYDPVYDLLSYASRQLPVTLLTNAMLLRGSRLERLSAINNNQLSVQVSLDGGQPDHHDAYRGKGSWSRTVEGIQTLLSRSFQVKLSTTETPANTCHLEDICQFHLALGIPEKDHIVRTMARRGFAQEGLEITKATLAPEITVNAEGIYWHPLATDEDLLITRASFSLSDAMQQVQEQMEVLSRETSQPLKTFQ